MIQVRSGQQDNNIHLKISPVNSDEMDASCLVLDHREINIYIRAV